jgi:hypothetical protein
MFMYKRIFALVAGILALMFTISVASPAQAVANRWSTYKTCAVSPAGSVNDYKVRVYGHGSAAGYQPDLLNITYRDSSDYPPGYTRFYFKWYNSAGTLMNSYYYDYPTTPGNIGKSWGLNWPSYNTSAAPKFQVQIGTLNAFTGAFQQQCGTGIQTF